MRKPIETLFVEDSTDDTELEVLELRSGGFDVRYQRVDTEEELRRALATKRWDLIIADYSMPGFSGMTALRIVQELKLDTPFILVSGTIGEHIAVQAMKAGAHDYVLKDHLTRLAAAVARELREAELRRERSRSERGARFLADATAALTESLFYETMLQRVADLTVPEIADWCVIHMSGEDGSLRRVALAHADSEKLKWARELQERYPPRPDLPHGPAAVVRSGRSELFQEVSDADLVVAASDAEHLAILRTVGITSYLSVPLRARESTFGAITFVVANSGRHYDESDLVLAEELARRTALAVDNARLFTKSQEAIRLRDDFLSVASHELKTPLTALLLQLQGMKAFMSKGQQDTQTWERLAVRVERTTASAERLTNLVENLLDVSRISSGRMRLNRERFDFSEMVREVVQRFREEAFRAGSELVARFAAESLVGSWDRLRIEQVLTNLLSNAIKYGAGKPIEVIVRAAPTRVILEVIDHGIGIAPENLKRIFERFERAVSLRHYGGLGLGLYITRQIIEAHGGEVLVTGAPETGATFRVELPLKPVRSTGKDDS